MQLKKTWPRLSAAALAAALVSSCSSKNGLSGYSIGSSKLPICSGTESDDASSNTSAKKCVTDDTLSRSAVVYVDALTGLPTCDATRKGAMYYVSQNKTLQSCDGSKWQIINAQGVAGPQGEKGAKGEAGTPAPTSIANYYTETGSVSTVVESAKTIARTVTKFWTAKNGTLIKTCTNDSWSVSTGVANGYKAFTRTYGDSLCGDMTTESLACNNGYASVGGECKAVCSSSNLAACSTIDACLNSSMSWVGDRCVGTCSASNLLACNSLAKCQGVGGSGPGVWIGSQCSSLCPAGQTPTSRGCEAATVCTATQQVSDNLCVDTSFAVQGGNLCGKYTKPIKLDSGYHLVNCDVEFQDAVTIEPGAVIAVDGAWTIRFAKTLYAIGTADLPITFEASLRNPAGKWLGLTIGNSHGYVNQSPFSVTGTYNFGTKVAYLTVKNLAEKANSGTLTLSGYITNLQATANSSAVTLGTTDAPLYLENSTVTGDTIGVQMGGTPATAILANTLTASTEFSPTAGIVARNTITAPNTQLSAGSPGLLLFNTITGNLSCSSANTVSVAQVYGNAVSGTTSLTSCGNKGSNASTLSTDTWAFADDGTLGRSTSAVTNRQVPLTALIMNSSGWVTNATVTLELTTVLDGTTAPVNLQPGYNPTVLIGLAGTYTSKVKQVTGLDSLLGNVSRTVSVNSQGNGPIVRTVGAITNTPTWMWTSSAGVTGRTFRYKLNDPNFMTTSTETKLLSYTAPAALLEGVHTFYVQEKDDNGNWSDATASSILLDKTVPNTPTPPTGPSPFTNSATVAFNWTNPGDNAEGSGVASYNVQIGTTAGSSNVFSGNVRGLSKTITGVDRGVYYARVQTVDYGGNVSPYSGSSASVTIDLLAPNTPDAPTAPSSLSNSDSLTFTWSSPGDNLGGSGIASYNVQIGTTPGGSDVFNGNVVGATSKTVAVTNGNIYYARVQAVDSAGNTSVWSANSNSVTVDLVAPNQPEAPTATSYSTRITRFTFTWTAPSDNPGGTGVYRYNVRIGTTPGGVDIYNGSETGLTKEVFGINGVVYYASVQAVDRAGNLSTFSPSSQAVIVDTTSPPQPAAPTTPNSLTNSGSVTFYWNTAADNTNGSGIASYNLQVGTSPGASDVFNGNVTTLERTVTLTNAPSYYARIQAVDRAGNLSAFSPSSTAVSVDLTPPTVGGGGIITVSNVTSSTLNLNWTIGSDNASLQTNLRYLVYYSSTDNIDTLANIQANGTPFGAWTTNINSATVTSLTPNSSYYFNILVEDQAGNRTAYQSVNGDTSMSTPWTWTKGSNTGEGNPIYGILNVGSSSNTPGARKQGVSWTDGSGGLWLFGGALTSGGSTSYYNDLWKYDGTNWIWRGGSQSPNQGGTYGTMGVGNTVNVPGARIGAVSWTDSTNRLWLFGGYGYSANGSLGYLNDLWKFDGTQWTWVAGSNSVNTVGTYGSRGVAHVTNVPGARQGSVAWINSSNELWLFGGTGFDSGGNTVFFNDLWKFDGNDWIWVSGSDNSNQAGAYGTKGIGSSANAPGARHSSVAWVNSAGHLFLYGGYGYDINGVQGKLNDLWKFTGGSWTWISGGATRNNPGIYGQKGLAMATNLPGARDGAISWADSSGYFWLFGGSGFDNNSVNGVLNDLWRFDGTNWTWISGSTSVNQLGIYGVQGSAGSLNVPGSRNQGVAWIDGSNTLWLFGGFGYDQAGNIVHMNDLWKGKP